MTWDEDRRLEDEVTDMALVGRRDGGNFGYGRQLSYAGPQVLIGMFLTNRGPADAILSCKD